MSLPFIVSACSPPSQQNTQQRQPAPTVAASSSSSRPTGQQPLPKTITINDSGGCAIGHRDRLLHCWDVKDGMWTLDPLPREEEGIKAVASGTEPRSRMCALTYAGHVFCMDDVRRKNRLAQIPGLEHVVDLSVDKTHACVVIIGGRVQCWGDNYLGQLGGVPTGDRGTNNHAETGFTDPGVEGAIEVWTGGRRTSCALDRNGTVWCWGHVGAFEAERRSPRHNKPFAIPFVVEGSVGVKAVHLRGSGRRPCIIDQDRHAHCWRIAHELDKADEDTIQTKPARAILPEPVIDASGTCVLRADGSVTCTGENQHGELGRGSFVPSTTFGPPVLDLGNVVELSSRETATCARISDGSIRCWGMVFYRDPKAPEVVPRPTRVRGLAPVNEVIAGMSSTCAITKSDGGLECWGDHATLPDAARKSFDRPANPDPTLFDSPHIYEGWIGEPQKMPIPDVLPGSLATLGGRTCALTRSGGEIRCTHVAGGMSQPLPHTPSGVKRVFVPSNAVCWETAANKLECLGGAQLWRFPSEGCAAPPTWPSKPAAERDVWPLELTGFGTSAHARSSLYLHGNFCAIGDDRRSIRCWGTEWFMKQLGMTLPAQPARCDRPATGTLAIKSGAPIKKLVVGYTFACVLDDQDAVRCFGMNEHGQLGRGNKTTKAESIDTVEALTPTADIFAGNDFACALSKSKVLTCWGKNAFGQIGDGTFGEEASRPSRTEVKLEGLTTSIKGVTLSPHAHACAWSEAGEVWCWGNNSDGQIGTGGRYSFFVTRPVELRLEDGASPI